MGKVKIIKRIDKKSAGMPEVIVDSRDYDRGAYYAGMKGGHTRWRKKYSRFSKD